MVMEDDIFNLYKLDLHKYDLLNNDEIVELFQIYRKKDCLNILTNDKLDFNILFNNICTYEDLNKLENYINKNYINKYPLNVEESNLINSFKTFKLNFKEKENISNIDVISELKLYNEILKAKEVIITSNLRLVINIAKKYYTKDYIIDLIGAGNEGLMKCLDKYDPSISKFSTYASFWINAYILRYLKNNTLIHVPLYLQEKIYKTKNEIEKLPKDYTDKQIIDNSSITKEEIENYNNYRELTTIASFNKLIDSEGNEADQYIKDEYDFVEKLIENEDREYLFSLLDTLSPKERNIIKYKYGIDYEVMKLKDIAALYNTSSSSINSTEKRAYQKLKKKILEDKKLYRRK